MSVKTLPMELGWPKAAHFKVCYGDPNFNLILPKSYGRLKTLSMSGWPTTKTTHFQGHGFFGDPNSDLIFAKILLERPLRPYLWSQLALKAKTAHFQVHGIFGYPDFRPNFFQNLTWTSVKTLSIEPIGSHGQNGSFSRLNDPQSRTLPMELVGPYGQNDPFSRSNDLQSRIPISYLLKFYLDIQPVHPPFCRCSYALINGIFDDPKFDLIFAKILPGCPLRPYLWSQLALKA
ncbi:hypothetical protein H5410_064073 [Solanum commersonii]|uniref:Uncharacterized protein n=1 Tax=Solanum commersonii TaxID=4109 RepID=A0A9J5W186_SOLCO|nr:hypothetical protein H5410_064073 [Solanum commersonii]